MKEVTELFPLIHISAALAIIIFVVIIHVLRKNVR